MPNPLRTEEPVQSRAARVLTDIHFWVPVGVLLAGLLLLRFIH
jgi:hypothetical protein